jgi:hypothetical protein
MKVGRLQNRANTQRGRLQLMVGTSENGRVTTRGLRETEQHPQSRRFACAVGAEETGDGSRFYGES